MPAEVCTAFSSNHQVNSLISSAENTYKRGTCAILSMAVLLSVNSTLMTLQPGIVSDSRQFSPIFSVDSSYNFCENLFSWEELSMMNRNLADSIDSIDSIAALADNWNQNGAPAFSERIIRNAKAIIFRLFTQPIILPTARGSIQFEYEKDNGDYLEFELFEDGRLKEFFYSHEDYSETQFIQIETADSVVREFYGRNI